MTPDQYDRILDRLDEIRLKLEEQRLAQRPRDPLGMPGWVVFASMSIGAFIALLFLLLIKAIP